MRTARASKATARRSNARLAARDMTPEEARLRDWAKRLCEQSDLLVKVIDNYLDLKGDAALRDALWVSVLMARDRVKSYLKEAV